VSEALEDTILPSPFENLRERVLRERAIRCLRLSKTPQRTYIFQETFINVSFQEIFQKFE
jgi:hypothetical protein